MNRRTFTIAGAASIALFGGNAFAQRTSRGQETVLISELTGAEIDFSGSGFTFESSEIDPDGAFEIFGFEKGDSYLSVSFFDEERTDHPTLFDEMLAVSQEEDENLTIHAHEHFEDGGFTALSFPGIATYREYQLGSFPGYSLLVMLVSIPDDFQTDFVASQSLLVGGGPPFLFVAESGVEAMVFESPVARSSAVTRTSRASTSTSTKEPEAADSNSSQVSSSAGSESDYIAQISDHRSHLYDSLERFYDLMAVFLDETSTEAEANNSLQSLILSALDWQGYPDEIAAIPVPPGMEEIGSLYADWGLTVADVGIGFMSIVTDGATGDDYNAAMAEFEEIDALLATAIGEARGSSNLVEIAGIDSKPISRMANVA